MNLVFTYLAVAITFVGLDMIWLRTMVERLYRPVLGDMLRSEPNLVPAAVFYLAYPAGLIACFGNSRTAVSVIRGQGFQ